MRKRLFSLLTTICLMIVVTSCTTVDIWHGYEVDYIIHYPNEKHHISVDVPFAQKLDCGCTNGSNEILAHRNIDGKTYDISIHSSTAPFEIENVVMTEYELMDCHDNNHSISKTSVIEMPYHDIILLKDSLNIPIYHEVKNKHLQRINDLEKLKINEKCYVKVKDLAKHYHYKIKEKHVIH